MRATFLADQQGIALRVITCIFSLWHDSDEASVSILRVTPPIFPSKQSCFSCFADMCHLGAGVRLLHIVGDRHRIELANRVLAAQDAARIFPGDRRAGLNLRPGNLRVVAAAVATLGDKVIDTADTVLISRVPVLHGRVLDLCVFQCDEFDDRCVQLIFVAHRCRAALKVTDVAAFVGDDERPFELTRVCGVNSEVGGKLHRTANAFRHINKRSVAEHGGIQRRKKIVAIRNDRAEIFFHSAPGDW